MFIQVYRDMNGKDYQALAQEVCTEIIAAHPKAQILSCVPLGDRIRVQYILDEVYE